MAAPPAPPRQHWLEHRIPPPVVDAACALLMWLLAQATPALQMDWPLPLRQVLFGLWAALGGAVAAAGLAAFAKARTTANPMQPQRAAVLVQGGIYRFTRNPMYVGMAWVLLGWACWLAHPLSVLCIVPALAYLQRFQIRPEERILQAHFGAQYAAYCRKVRRWL